VAFDFACFLQTPAFSESAMSLLYSSGLQSCPARIASIEKRALFFQRSF
jgi:hypothetical protein